LREAVTKEDQLAYDEPADWFVPTRHPNNGWALFGLVQSLKLQNRSADASAVRQQFDTAWKNAT
jgi:hypothetical protein